MGGRTDLIGHIEITPSLNFQEQDYLRVFAASRRHRRSGGPYTVSGGPHGEADHPAGDMVSYGTPADGQPGLRCHWAPSCGGRCLSHIGGEDIAAPAGWLRYLIDHFLRPGAFASAARRPEFAAFTFDHVCNGIVAGCDRDTATMFLVRVTDNVVTEETLADGEPERAAWGPFGYEDDIDRRRTLRARPRRRRLTYPPTVVPLRPVGSIHPATGDDCC